MEVKGKDKTEKENPVCGEDLSETKTSSSASKWIFVVNISTRGVDYPTGPVKIVANHKVVINEKDYEASTAQQYVKKRPHVSIDDSLPPVTEGDSTTFTVSGGCSEINQSVSVTVASGAGGSESSTTINCDNNNTWKWEVPTSEDRSTFPTGDITITAFQNSGAVTIPPNTSPETLKSPEKTLVIQRMPRVGMDGNLSSISVASDGGNASSYTISGKCTEKNSSDSVIVQVGGTVTSDVSCSSSEYSLSGSCRETGKTNMPVWAEEGRSTTTTTCTSEGTFSLTHASCTQGDKNITVLAGGLLRKTDCSSSGTWTVSNLDVSDKKLFPTGIVSIRVYHLSAISISTKGVLVTSGSENGQKDAPCYY